MIIVTANGDLDLSTDTGQMVARILGSVATASPVLGSNGERRAIAHGDDHR
jgi:hypothetical protein